MRTLEWRRRAPGRSPLYTILVWTGVRKVLQLIFMILYRYRRSGMEHVPREGPVIYASSHQSHFDPVLVGMVVGDRPFSSLARDNLFASAPIGAFLRFMGAVPIQRGRGDTGAIRAALGELQAGRCVLVFPEGTRSRDGRLGPFHRGVILVASRSGAPVVPAAVDGAHEVWPPSRRFPRLLGRVRARVGAPITAEELTRDGPEAGLALLRERIEALRCELRAPPA